MVPALEPLPPELRQSVSARSLPDGALDGMRRALACLGGLDDEDDDKSSSGADEMRNEPKPSTSAAASSLVTALAAEEVRRETQLWERMMYKSASQHRKAVHFQRMRGVSRHLRALSALDVGAAALALRDSLREGVSEEARAAALASPAVAAGAHAIWKLPPRALWEDLARRLRATARVATEADDALLAAALALSGQLAHTYFMPFALIATASVARLRAGLHQLVVDIVSSYNVLAPLLNGGVMPPPGLPLQDGSGDEQNNMPELLRCEWSAVTLPLPLPGATASTAMVANRLSGGNGKGGKEKESSPAVKPIVRAVEASLSTMGMICDEDWSWRLLHQVVPQPGLGAGGGLGAGMVVKAKVKVDGEDLGAIIPRNVRGLAAEVDRGDGGGRSDCDSGGHDGSNEQNRSKNAPVAPSYSRLAFGLGLGGSSCGKSDTSFRTQVRFPAAGTAAAAVDDPTLVQKSKPSLAQASKTVPPPVRSPAPSMMNLASLTSALKPKAAADIMKSTAGGKKRRRSGASEGVAGGTAKDSTLTEDSNEKKKKKKKKQGGGAEKLNVHASNVSKPQSAVDRAMALLLGGK